MKIKVIIPNSQDMILDLKDYTILRLKSIQHDCEFHKLNIEFIAI